VKPEGLLSQLKVPATCPYPEPARSSQHPPLSTSRRSILILPSHLRLGLPSNLFPSRFPLKPLYIPLLSPHTCYMFCPSRSFRFITWTILSEEYRSLSSTLCSFFHSTVTSSLLGLNIHLNTPFSNTLRLHSSHTVRGQVSHPYKTAGQNIFHYILIFKFLENKLEDKRFCTKCCQHSVTAVCL
jgi:hypothetical protein